MSEEERKPNIFNRINLIMQEVDSVIKNAEIGYGRNSYKGVTHDAVTAAIREHFVKYGVCVIPNTEKSETSYIEINPGTDNSRWTFLNKTWVTVTFVNVDDRSDAFSVKEYAEAADTLDKSPGKAKSMAVKMAYLKVLMLESLENEESRIDIDPFYKTKTSPHKAEPDINEYVVGFGKFSGKRLDQIDKSQLESYLAYISSNGAPKGKAKEFYDIASAYLRINGGE